jgi:hypothetical protein
MFPEKEINDDDRSMLAKRGGFRCSCGGRVCLGGRRRSANRTGDGQG